MQTFLVIIHVIVSVLLILLILLQQGSGGGLSGMFGGGGSMTDIFSSPSGDAFFRKATAILATLFMSISLIIAIGTANTDKKSLLENISEPLGEAQESSANTDDLMADFELELEE
ncbi:MAG: preprotein translocase subunit SecG [Elusimicrobia bacterium]|nr:preprotein translocase subunit SecG [Elusimicrobiota bacterium]